MAATAEARVCNRALLRIGQTRLIESLAERTNWARACKALYADSRDATLEARDWPFARRRKVLAPLTDGARGGYAFAYPLPPDCLAPRFIDPAGGQSDVADTGASLDVDPSGLMMQVGAIPFETEDEVKFGRLLVTDWPDAELVYTARIEAVPRFTATFLDALAYKLASDLALGVAKRPALGEQMLRAFELTLARAAAASSKQMKPRARPRSSFEKARG